MGAVERREVTLEVSAESTHERALEAMRRKFNLLLRVNGVAIMVNKRVRNAVLGCSLKNDTMISVHSQVKPFNSTVIQVYAPTSNAEEAKRFYEDLEDLLELTPKKDFASQGIVMQK